MAHTAQQLHEYLHQTAKTMREFSTRSSECDGKVPAEEMQRYHDWLEARMATTIVYMQAYLRREINSKATVDLKVSKH